MVGFRSWRIRSSSLMSPGRIDAGGVVKGVLGGLGWVVAGDFLACITHLRYGEGDN